jgi:hypothetical protein
MKSNEIIFVENHSFILEGGTLNAQFYLEVMEQLLQRICLVSPDFCENKICFIAQQCTRINCVVQKFIS